MDVLLNGPVKTGNHIVRELPKALGCGAYEWLSYGTDKVKKLYAYLGAKEWNYPVTNNQVTFWVHNHLEYLPAIAEFLLRERIKMILTMRDPRDVVASYYRSIMARVHFEPEENLLLAGKVGQEEMINLLIAGDQKIRGRITPISQWGSAWLPWMQHSGCLVIRFEDLVTRHKESVSKILSFIGIGKTEPPNLWNEHSLTFVPGGKVGCWRSYFSENNVKVFKEASEDLLVWLDYETNNDWRL